MNRSIALLALVIAGAPIVAQAQAHPGAPPFAGRKAMTCAEAYAAAPKADPELAPLVKAVVDAEAKLKKTPTNGAAKKAVVDAAFKYGDTLLHLAQGKLTPPVQYRASLAAFRKVLAIDPKHARALAEKQTIEDIYRGMPGGIPK